ncbi:hypothetical protein D3C81_1464330 [compost metagenome]
MEKRGLVERKPLDTDRGVQVLLTAAGRSALEDARPVVSQGIRKYFLDPLTEEDITSITKFAERTKPGSSGNLPPS